MRSTSLLFSVCWLAQLTACNLSVDSKLIKNERDSGVEIEPPIDSGSPNPRMLDGSMSPDPVIDSGVRPDPEIDSSVWPDPRIDSGFPEVDSGGPGYCVKDADCLDDEYYCGAPDYEGDRLRCRKRCDEAIGCTNFGGKITSMTSDGKTFYWSVAPALDKLGNPLNDGEVWAWDPAAEPSRILTYDAKLLLVVDGTLYFSINDVISRLALNAAATPEVMDNAAHVWATDQYVWWTARAADKSELWRKRRNSVDAAEKLGVNDHPAGQEWSAGTATTVFRQYYQDAARVNAATISDLQTESEVLSIPLGTLSIAANETSLFSVDTEDDSRVAKRDPAQPVNQSPIYVGGRSDSVTSFVVRGSWVYWASQPNGQVTQALFGRAPVSMPASAEDLLTGVTGPVDYSQMLAVVGDTLLYYHRQDARLFYKKMPPHPCSSSLPCPTGLSCSADLVCR